MDFLVFVSVISVLVTGSFAFDSETYRCPASVKVTRYVKTYQDHCYEFVAHEMTWYGAYDACADKGGHLVVIRDRGTQNFILKTLRSFHWPYNGVWLGATDRENEMVWKWVTKERVRYGYRNWAPGQPSCHIFCFEDCAQLRLDDKGRWHDYKCDWFEDYSFVCQYPLSPKTSTTSTTTTTTSTTTTTTTTTPTTTTVTTTSTTAEVNNTANATGLGLNPNVRVEVVQELGDSQRSMLGDGDTSTNDTVSITVLVLGLPLGILLGICFGIFFFRRRNKKEKEDAPNVYFHNPFYADIRSPLTATPSEEKSALACCGGGAATPVKRPLHGPPVPKKDYDIPLPIRDSMDGSQIDDITAEKLLYAQKCGKAAEASEAVGCGAVGGGGVGDEYERYVEPRYVESPDDDDEEALVDNHIDHITGENYYECMENVRLAMRQNALNEQQEERYVPFQFQSDELGYQKV